MQLVILLNMFRLLIFLSYLEFYNNIILFSSFFNSFDLSNDSIMIISIPNYMMLFFVINFKII